MRETARSKSLPLSPRLTVTRIAHAGRLKDSLSTIAAVQTCPWPRCAPFATTVSQSPTTRTGIAGAIPKPSFPMGNAASAPSSPARSPTGGTSCSPSASLAVTRSCDRHHRLRLQPHGDRQLSRIPFRASSQLRLRPAPSLQMPVVIAVHDEVLARKR